MFRSMIIICLGICLAGNVCAQSSQDVSGNWYGFFRTPQGSKQRLQLLFEKQGQSYKGQMKSPDATEEMISLDTIAVKGDTLRFSIKRISLVYVGVWSLRHERFDGYFEQMGNRVELDLSRKEIKPGELPSERPQDPTAPFAYDVEEVKFVNAVDKVLLTGTLTKPGVKGPFPAVVMISGSGPQDRDGETLGHRPFAVIADYFTKHGIAVLRFDDRSMGGSTGNYDSSDLHNFANDVRAAVSFLSQRPDIDTGHIGLLGQNQGGSVAEIVAADNSRIAFMIAMGAPGLDGLTLYNTQLAATAKGYGENDAYIREYQDHYKPYLNLLIQEKDTVTRRTKGYDHLSAIYNHFGDSANVSSRQQFVIAAYHADTRGEALSALKYDPAVYLAKVKCPVLAINGSKDVQLDADANLRAIAAGLVKGGNQKVTIRKFPGLNHLFQRCNTCRVEEYGTLDETINPAVLEFMTKWMEVILF